MSDNHPVAWAVGGPDGPHVFWSREEARQYMRDTLSDNVVELYKRPEDEWLRLTDAERLAVNAVICRYETLYDEYGASEEDIATITALRGLLKRMGDRK